MFPDTNNNDSLDVTAPTLVDNSDGFGFLTASTGVATFDEITVEDTTLTNKNGAEAGANQNGDKETNDAAAKDDGDDTTEPALDKEIRELMATVNHELEDCLTEQKTSTKRLFLALKKFADMAAQIHTEWDPIQQSEHAESQRLDDVQNDVNLSMRGVLGGLDE